MSNIALFSPKEYEQSLENVGNFIAAAKELQPWSLNIDFLSDEWVVPIENNGRKSKRTIRFSFVHRKFRDLVKAIVLVRKQESGIKTEAVVTWVQALAYLARAATTQGVDNFASLVPIIFSSAEEDIERHAFPSQQAKFASILEAVSVMANDFRLVRRKLIWRLMTGSGVVDGGAVPA